MRILIVEHKLDSSVKEGFRANPEVFTQVLRTWKIPEQLIERMEIVVEIRDMIPDGGFGGRNNDCFIIYLQVNLFQGQLAELNAVIAHELKHLWYLVMMPNERFECGDGFWINKRKYRWEEKECRRMEKKHTHTPFIAPL